MKRKALLLLSAFLLLVAAPAFASDVLLFGFSGFDFENPNPDPTTYLAVGEGYEAVGYITSAGSIIAPAMTSGAEGTFHLFNLAVTGNFFFSPYLTVVFAPAGRMRFFEDFLTPAAYGVNPPNGTVPASFVDGVMLLGGQVDNFVLTYDYSRDHGDFSGDLTLDEGSSLGYIPTTQRAGWVLGGLAGQPNPSIPQGYDHQVQGEARIPGSTPATHRTWGAVKALYR